MKNPRKINLIVVHCIGIRDVTALRCSEPLRNKDGGASQSPRQVLRKGTAGLLREMTCTLGTLG